MQQFEGKTALVTGAASGIGRAMAERFAAEGMALVLVDVDEPGLERAAADLGGEAHVVDVTDTEALEAVARNVPTVHVLCPNAGVAPVGPVLDMDKATWDWVIGVNLQQVVHLTRLYGPRMVEQGEGHIVYTASGAGILAVPTLGPYCVTKHGVVALAETLFLELQGTGYRAELKGAVLNLSLGLSHPVNFPVPHGIMVTIPGDSKGTVIQLEGADKEVMGQTAATIRGFRPPGPYGGKGVRYRGEKVREKAGKAGGKVK